MPTAARIQLARWTKLGLLTGAPAADAAPRNAHWLDPQQPLAARARAYLDINCGHCHSATGPANTTGLLLEAKVDADRHLGLCKPPVAAGRGTGDHLFDIVPGKPDDSILPFRMASHETGVMMPEQNHENTTAMPTIQKMPPAYSAVVERAKPIGMKPATVISAPDRRGIAPLDSRRRLDPALPE
jgi:hypothetical protein